MTKDMAFVEDILPILDEVEWETYNKKYNDGNPMRRNIFKSNGYIYQTTIWRYNDYEDTEVQVKRESPNGLHEACYAYLKSRYKLINPHMVKNSNTFGRYIINVYRRTNMGKVCQYCKEYVKNYKQHTITKKHIEKKKKFLSHLFQTKLSQDAQSSISSFLL